MNILLVEDSRILRERLRSMIAAIPSANLVAEADNESDASSYLQQHRPDIAIIDIRLKAGSGLSVLAHITATYPVMTTIVLTNYAQAEYRSKCMALGAHYFFDKTSDIKRFDKLLHELSQSELDRSSMSTHQSGRS